MERPLPRLHLVTDDATLERPDLLSVAGEVLSTGGSALALHVRGPSSSCARITALAQHLRGAAAASGSVLLVNDRVDVALALRLAGVHLGQRSLTPPVARELLGPDALIGRSVHDLGEAGDPENRDADYLVAGSVFPTSSHPGKPGGGVDLLRQIGAETTLPILAIGGITASRVQEVMVPGVFGVAVLSGVWRSEDPGEAVAVYLKELNAATGS